MSKRNWKNKKSIKSGGLCCLFHHLFCCEITEHTGSVGSVIVTAAAWMECGDGLGTNDAAGSAAAAAAV